MNIADRQKPAPGTLFVDHVSHFVADLDAAARVLEALGMKVTPASVQQTPEGPVGASNRCVMLEEGYIELLSPTHDTPAATRMRALMRRYDGVHVLCYGTPDAEAEHRRLQAHGFEPQPLVELSRAVDGGTAPPAPAIAGYAVRSSHPEKLAARCKAAGITVKRHGKRYAATLPKTLGGAWLFG